jgi:hypothetical protein
MNQGIDLFENYDDVEINPEEYKKECLRYFKRAFKELDYYNNQMYESMSKLSVADVVEKISLLNNVTIYSSGGEEKNYTLRQSMQMIISNSLPLLNLPVEEYSMDDVHINWLISNANRNVRA